MKQIIFSLMIFGTTIFISFNYFFGKVIAMAVGENRCMAKIDDGTGIGLDDIGVTGTRMCVFYGIRYAQAPLGKLRFEPPEPFHWKDKSNFVQKPEKCPQLSRYMAESEENVEGHEDCLFLNVYRPLKIPKGRLLPVFFWIHGGSFNTGSFDSDINGFDYFIKENFIVVSPNYRLGVLGFLSVPHLNITGNNGLKDQQLALQWVHRNIKNFGGDPNRVTLMGWSAGAASVTYHMYNEESQKYFQKAIVMSGTMLDSWAFTSNNEFCGKNYLNYVGLASKEELQTIDFIDLMPRLLESLTFAFFGMHHLCFVPTIEPEWAKNRFLSTIPTNLMKKNTIKNNISLLIGLTALESVTMYPHIEYYMKNIFFPNTNKKQVNESIREYIDAYTKGHFKDDKDQDKFLIKLALMADTVYNTRKFLEVISETTKDAFGYQFSFEGSFGNFKQNTDARWESLLTGAVHGDDLGYIFPPFYENTGFDQLFLNKEIMTARQMVKMWSDFGYFGNPTPKTDELMTTKWTPFPVNHEIMNINGTLKMAPFEDSEQYRLWDQIYHCLYDLKCNFLEENKI